MSEVVTNKQETSMAEFVGKQKTNVINSGVVKEAAEQSISLLKDKESALGIRASRKRRGGAGRACESRKQVSKDFSSPADKTDGKVSKSKSTNIKNAAKRSVISTLNESDEFKGSEKPYDAYRTSKRATRYLKEHSKKGSATKAARASTTKATHAAGTSKLSASKAASAAKSQLAQAQRAAMQNIAGAVKSATASVNTAIAGAASGSGVAAGGGVLAGVIAFILCAVVLGQLISSLFGFWEAEHNKQSLEGLPPYITLEMVEEAIRCQEEFGHPAGATIAQIICESGQGETMSQLATRDHNLFGMKWSTSFASAPEVRGKSAWVTNEEYTLGVITTITDYFTVFVGYTECIRFRSRVFLQVAHYRNNALIRAAITEHSSDKMAEGLKDAGWATSSEYVESLKSALDTYGLRRFDSMSLADFRASARSSSAIVRAAYSQLGVPYVWGGSTPGVGLDCSGLTQYCYRQAGIVIPRNTEAQAAFGRKVPVSEAAPGDILWRPGHVAIFIGDNKYIHEPSSGLTCTIASGVSYFTSAIKIG